MGLLSALPFSQVTGYGPGWGDYQRRQQQQQRPMQYAAAQPQAMPQMPSLTAPPNGQPMGPDPFAPAPVAPQMTPGMAKEPTMPQEGGGGFFNRLNKGFGSLTESPLFNVSMALLANSERGGDWGGFSQDLRQYGQDQTQRQRAQDESRRNKVADTRDESIFGRQQTEWQRQDEQLGRWRSAIQAEQDPQRRSQLEAIGPDGYAQYTLQNQQMQFQSRENQLNRDNDRRVAATRSANENSFGRYFQAMDAQTIGDLNQQSAQLQAVGMPQLYALRDTIAQAGLNLTGQPIDYNNRITLGRYFNGSSGERQTLEVWRAQILGPALETLRGLGAMSEREMDAAIQSFSNPNMTLGAAQQLIDQRIAIAQRRIETANHANSYFQQYGGLTGSGPGWPQYLAEQLGSELPANTTAGAPGMGGGAPPAPTSASPGSQIPAAAVTDLRSDPSPQARREFDAVFGQGAAARILGQNRAPQAARGGRPGAF